MTTVEFEFIWLVLMLFSSCCVPELIKSWDGNVFTTLFAMCTGAYWWLSSKVIREIWDT